MLDIANVSGMPRQIQSLYPERQGRSPAHGLSDHGGAAWQSEPAQNFMRHCIYRGDSPYWNPYSAAGSFGPETLVDIKFSPVSLLVAAMGGTVAMFHFVVLLLYVSACYFLFRLLTLYWNISRLSAIATCFVFMLNGYFIANLNSNVAQSILFYPMCLYALVSFAHRPSSLKYIGIVLSSSLILLATFMPTTSLLFVCVYFIAGIYTIVRTEKVGVGISLLLCQWSAAVLSFVILAFLYFPIVESFSFVNPFSMYGARVFYPSAIKGFLSVFTPKHFWESYLAMDETAWSYTGNVIFHFGITASLITAQTFRKEYMRNYFMVALMGILLVALGRIFDIPVVSTVVSHLPFFGNIGEQYLWIAVSVAFTLLFPFGLDAISRMTVKPFPCAFIYLIIIADAIYLYVNYGLPTNHEVNWFLTRQGAILYLVILFLLLAAAGMFLYFIRMSQSRRKTYFTIGLVLLAIAEMIFYMNSIRYTRLDIFRNPPDYVKFIKDRIGNHRIVNYGQFGVFAEVGAAFQIQQIESMNMSIFPSYYSFFNRNFLTDNDRWGNFCAFRTQNDPPKINETMLDMLGVKYIVVTRYMDKYESFFRNRKYPVVFQNDQLQIFENEDCHDRILAVNTILENDLTPDTKGYSPRDVLFTKDRKMMELARVNRVNSDPGKRERDAQQGNDEVTLLKYRHSNIKAHAKLRNPSVIAIMDNWHPNWKAYANGKELYIGKVNESFRGIVLPPGEYNIEFIYRPKSLIYGLVLTGIVILSLVALFVYRKKIDLKLDKYLTV